MTKKILLVIHGEIFPESEMQFIANVNKTTPVLLSGFFIPSIVPVENWAAYSEFSTGVLEDVITSANMQRFGELCTSHGLESRAHTGSNEDIFGQLKKETRYSDLVIVSTGSFYKEVGTKDAYPYVEELMRDAECPVMVLSGNGDLPSEVILNYDGTKTSMYAIKQFAYLFPELRLKPTHLFHFTGKENILSHKEQIEDWCKSHFPNFSMMNVRSDAESFYSFLDNTNHMLAVTGAHSRSIVSEWLRKSFSADLIKNIGISVFSAHP